MSKGNDKKTVSLMLDREYHLRLTVDSLSRLYKKIRVPNDEAKALKFFNDRLEALDPVVISRLLWASLLWNDKSLKPKQVDKWLKPFRTDKEKLGKVVCAINAALVSFNDRLMAVRKEEGRIRAELKKFNDKINRVKASV